MEIFDVTIKNLSVDYFKRRESVTVDDVDVQGCSGSPQVYINAHQYTGQCSCTVIDCFIVSQLLTFDTMGPTALLVYIRTKCPLNTLII